MAATALRSNRLEQYMSVEQACINHRAGRLCVCMSNLAKSLHPAAYAVGDQVVVKNYGRATVIEPVQEEPGHKFFGRCKVQYHSDGSNYFCRPYRLRKLQPTQKRVLVCAKTREYQEAVVHNTDVNDVCLEIGCHVGITTALIHARCKYVVGVDVSIDGIQRAKEQYPGIRFEVVDGFDMGKLAALSSTGSFDKIFVDIGGIAKLHNVMELVGHLFKAFPRATIIVKNVYMKHLISEAEAFQLYCPDWRAALANTSEPALGLEQSDREKTDAQNTNE